MPSILANSYLNVMRIAGLASARAVSVDWRPFRLMPILAAQGMHDGPFLPFPCKLRYMWRDLERRAQKHGLPYHWPSTCPPNTLLTARVGVLAGRAAAWIGQLQSDAGSKPGGCKD